MHLSLDDFCEVVRGLQTNHTEMALAILWYFDQEKPDVAKASGELVKVMDNHHLGVGNTTRLAEAIRKTKLANETRAGFSLKPGSRRIIRGWLPEELEGLQPAIDHNTGYLSEAVWKNTRGYVEAVCRELNGCYQSAYYNAAAVMLRRLLETLIIESYEKQNREVAIKDGGGNYYMLADLVDRACGENNHAGLNLGRDAKKALKEARNIGNWSAHARRYIAKAPDLNELRPGVRLLAQELIHIAYDK